MNEKRMFKRMICMMLIICCFIVSINFNDRIHIKAETVQNVTNSISGKNDIKKLIKYFTSPCGYTLIYKMHIGDRRNYDFSKESDRKYIVTKQDKVLNKTKTSNLSKRLFGRRISEAESSGGNWGTGWPEIRINKIYRISLKKYRIDADIMWLYSKNGTAQINMHKIGTVKISLKKSADSFYGYVARSMLLKKINDV